MFSAVVLSWAGLRYNRNARFFALAALCAGSLACIYTTNTKASNSTQVQRIHDVRTTAYTHTESDHIVFSTKNAAGGNLKYGNVRSAAADWSVYPVGTKFQIEGDPCVYEVDDYGSALVGTKTIDLYKPSKASMDKWGVRNVNINVIEWGSFEQSLAIMKPRQKYSSHVRKMVQEIENGTPQSNLVSL
jgi:3D (Asp-Asp-Asp) domain-containing protein